MQSQSFIQKCCIPLHCSILIFWLNCKVILFVKCFHIIHLQSWCKKLSLIYLLYLIWNMSFENSIGLIEFCYSTWTPFYNGRTLSAKNFCPQRTQSTRVIRLSVFLGRRGSPSSRESQSDNDLDVLMIDLLLDRN